MQTITGDASRFRQSDRRLSGTLTVKPTEEEQRLLGSVGVYPDQDAATIAQRWALPLLRAAMPRIRAQQNRLARYGDRPLRGGR